MEEKFKNATSKTELENDKGKALTAGLGAVTGAAAVGAAVYVHVSSPDEEPDVAGEVQSGHLSDAVVSSVSHPNAPAASEEETPVNEEVDVWVEAEDVSLVQDVSLPSGIAGEYVDDGLTLASPPFDVVDMEGNEVLPEDMLLSDEQVAQDFQESDVLENSFDSPFFEESVEQNLDDDAYPYGTNTYLI